MVYLSIDVVKPNSKCICLCLGADIPQRIHISNVHTMTPNNQTDSPQLSAEVDALQLDHRAANELEAGVGEGVNISAEDGLDSDPLQKFLRSPPEEKCLDELQVSTYLLSAPNHLQFRCLICHLLVVCFLSTYASHVK